MFPICFILLKTSQVQKPIANDPHFKLLQDFPYHYDGMRLTILDHQ